MHNITLYTHPFSRGRYVVWMLKECGAEYTVVPVQFGTQMKSAEYLAINPQGQVPALKFGDAVLTESTAITSSPPQVRWSAANTTAGCAY